MEIIQLGCKSELLGRVCDKLGNDEHFSLILLIVGIVVVVVVV